jgi:hypothetical protein
MSAGASVPFASGVDSGSAVDCVGLGDGSAIVVIVSRDEIYGVIDASRLFVDCAVVVCGQSRLVVWEALLELDIR